MCLFLLIAPVVLCAVELWVLIQVGGLIGNLQTVLLVCLTAVVGLASVRGQGVATLRQIQRQGGLPRDAQVLEGPLLAVAALCLLVPGFISDAVGVLLLLPPVRRRAAQSIVDRSRGRRTRKGGRRASSKTGLQVEQHDGETIIVVKRID